MLYLLLGAWICGEQRCAQRKGKGVDRLAHYPPSCPHERRTPKSVISVSGRYEVVFHVSTVIHSHEATNSAQVLHTFPHCGDV